MDAYTLRRYDFNSFHEFSSTYSVAEANLLTSPFERSKKRLASASCSESPNPAAFVVMCVSTYEIHVSKSMISCPSAPLPEKGWIGEWTVVILWFNWFCMLALIGAPMIEDEVVPWVGSFLFWPFFLFLRRYVIQVVVKQSSNLFNMSYKAIWDEVPFRVETGLSTSSETVISYSSAMNSQLESIK